MIRRFLAYNFSVLDVARIYRLLGDVVAGAAWHGPVQLWVQSAGAIGIAWDPEQCVWVRPGLSILPPHTSISDMLFGMPGVPRSQCS